jgi:hypothetical protein
MKKLFYATIISLMVAGCGQPGQKETAISNKSRAMI